MCRAKANATKKKLRAGRRRIVPLIQALTPLLYKEGEGPTRSRGGTLLGRHLRLTASQGGAPRNTPRGAQPGTRPSRPFARTRHTLVGGARALGSVRREGTKGSGGWKLSLFSGCSRRGLLDW